MTTRQQIIDEARSWLGTPFMHQQSIKGVGVDCVGFIAEVAKSSGAIPEAPFEANYRRHEDGSEMLRLLNDHMDYVPPEEIERGDVIALFDELLKFKDVPRHLVILTEFEPYRKIIHASERGVVEHKFGFPFNKRVHSVWRIRDLDA